MLPGNRRPARRTVALAAGAVTGAAGRYAACLVTTPKQTFAAADQRGIGRFAGKLLRAEPGCEVLHVLIAQRRRLGIHQHILPAAVLEGLHRLDQVAFVLAGETRPLGVETVAICTMAARTDDRAGLACFSRARGMCGAEQQQTGGEGAGTAQKAPQGNRSTQGFCGVHKLVL